MSSPSGTVQTTDANLGHKRPTHEMILKYRRGRPRPCSPTEWNWTSFRNQGLSSRPELLIPEGDEKRSGGTCCFVHGQQRIRKQKQKALPERMFLIPISVQRHPKEGPNLGTTLSKIQTCFSFDRILTFAESGLICMGLRWVLHRHKCKVALFFSYLRVTISPHRL